LLDSILEEGLSPGSPDLKYRQAEMELEDIEKKDGKKERVIFSHHDCALQLLHLRASPHVASKDGWTPLLLSARRGNADLCDILLKMDGEINQTTRDGWGLVHLGALGGSASMVHLALRLEAKHPTSASVCKPDERFKSLKVVEGFEEVEKEAMTALALMRLDRVREVFSLRDRIQKATHTRQLRNSNHFPPMKVNSTYM